MPHCLAAGACNNRSFSAEARYLVVREPKLVLSIRTLLVMLLLAFAATATGLAALPPGARAERSSWLPPASRSAVANPQAATPSPQPRGLNPNDAPWWELAALPRLGEQTARRIVEYRAQRRRILDDPTASVFRRAEDLQAVHGIGPATVAAIRPFLTLN